MGAALARAAQWTAADSGTGTLEITPSNESLLNQIIKFVEDFSTRHPQEAEFVFREPLEWKTQLDCSVFGEGYEINEATVQSEGKGKDGQPLLLLTASTLRVRSFDQLSSLLQITMERKLREAQACLEANRDPIVKILGPEYGTVEREDMSMLHLLDKVKKDDPEAEMKMKIFLLLHQLELHLLNSSLKRISQHIRINTAAINHEVNLLKNFSGKGEDTVLESLEYTSDYMFSNGCRAPPWRQMHGEICYLVIKPHDTDPLYITCSTAGVFLNGVSNKKGFLEGPKKVGQYSRTTSSKPRSNASQKKRKAGKNARRPAWMNKELLDTPRCKKKVQRVKARTGSLEEIQRSCPSSQMSGDAVYLFFSKISGRFEDVSGSSSESEADEEQPVHHQEGNTDLPSEYWEIQKLAKFLKVNKRHCRVYFASNISDFKWCNNRMQILCQLNGEVTISMHVKVYAVSTARLTIGSLKILKEISQNTLIRHAIADLGGLEIMVKILDSPDKDIKYLAAETIANVARFKQARRTVRQHGGIKRLVGLLECSLTSSQAKDTEIARCGALALWSCSKSTKNKEAIRKAGGIPLLARWLKCSHADILTPVVGTLQECASEPSYRVAIRTEGMIENLVKNLSSEHEELQMHCANAIFK
ncbi:ARMC4 protein, partial [Brachypteracias leptosomus]|nr:ARMC4 protein [Brachypteracias leptosomus]